MAMAWSDWVESKVRGLRGVTGVEHVGPQTLRIARSGRPDVVVFCPRSSGGAVLTQEAAQEWLDRTPDADFAALPPMCAAEGAYELLRDRGIAVGTFGDLAAAVERTHDVHTYTPRLASYIEQRLRTHSQVEGLQWNGHLIYRVLRSAALGDVRTAFGEPYEVSADWVLDRVDKSPYPLDAVVTSNPNCKGIADPALAAGHNAGVRVLTMQEFLGALHRTWRVA